MEFIEIFKIINIAILYLFIIQILLLIPIAFLTAILAFAIKYIFSRKTIIDQWLLKIIFISALIITITSFLLFIKLELWNLPFLNTVSNAYWVLLLIYICNELISLDKKDKVLRIMRFSLWIYILVLSILVLTSSLFVSTDSSSIKHGIYISFTLLVFFYCILVFLLPILIKTQEGFETEVKVLNQRVGNLKTLIDNINIIILENRFQNEINELLIVTTSLDEFTRNNLSIDKNKYLHANLHFELLEKDTDRFIKNELRYLVHEKISISLTQVYSIKNEFSQFFSSSTTLDELIKIFIEYESKINEIEFSKYTVSYELDRLISNFTFFNDVKKSISLYKNTYSQLDIYENELKELKLYISIANELNWNVLDIPLKTTLLIQSLEEFKNFKFEVENVNSFVEKYKSIYNAMHEISEQLSLCGIDISKKFIIQKNAGQFLFVFPKFNNINSSSKGLLILLRREEGVDKAEITINGASLKIESNAEKIQLDNNHDYKINRFTFSGDKHGDFDIVFSCEHFNSDDKKIYLPIKVLPTKSFLISSILNIYAPLGAFLSLLMFFVLEYLHVDNSALYSSFSAGVIAIILFTLFGFRYYMEIKRYK